VFFPCKPYGQIPNQIQTNTINLLCWLLKPVEDKDIKSLKITNSQTTLPDSGILDNQINCPWG